MEMDVHSERVFQVYPDQEDLGRYVKSILQFFGWNRTSVVYEEEFKQVNGWNEKLNFVQFGDCG